MAENLPKIMLVEPEPDIVEILVSSISKRLDTQITCVADAESCLDVDLVDPHPIVISEIDLPDMHGVTLAEKLTTLSRRAMILLTDDPMPQDSIEAMRLGVRDLLIKPFPVTDLLDSLDRAVHSCQVHEAHTAKYRRMRKLVRQVLRERRELNERIELVCRDLVGAHRRLMNRVLESEKTRT